MRVHPRAGSDSPWPSGVTKVFCVIGDPVEHSLSPALFNSVFASGDLDAVYVAFTVAAGSVGRAMEGFRAQGISGISVTMPHKEAVIPYLDGLSDRARKLNSVNCVYWEGSRLIGDSTDGSGFTQSLQSELGEPIFGKVITVVGTGGAARAIALALCDAGADRIYVVGRRPDASQRVIELAPSVARFGSLEVIASSDIVINATSVGMAGTGSAGLSPVPGELLSPSQLVYDIIYSPLETELLRLAQVAGARSANGVGMLVHQAAEQYVNWTGEQAPLDVMLSIGGRLVQRR